MKSLSKIFPDRWRQITPGVDELLESLDVSLREEIMAENINPTYDRIFRAFELRPNDVKVIILGQDPYPNSSHATGLAFSVPQTIHKFPPTLKNILKEYVDDLGFPIPASGDLSPWQNQGVLLLNPILTTEPGKSLAHQKKGWEIFTDAILASLNNRPIVAILWGNGAKNYENHFNPELCIRSVHPSPLSAYRGFFGSKPFSRANSLLNGAGISPVNWRL